MSAKTVRGADFNFKVTPSYDGHGVRCVRIEIVTGSNSVAIDATARNLREIIDTLTAVVSGDTPNKTGSEE